MEESSYVPNSIPPALVVFSQAGYGDAIRMQRPFGTQASDGKDLSLSSLSPSSFGLRPMESYGGLPAQLVHLQNPFLHPALEARLPFGTAGAFRPVVTSTSSTSTSSSSVDDRMTVKNLPSAFTTPNLSNRRKLDAIVEGVMEQHHQSNRSRSSHDGNSFAPSASSVGVINLDKSSPSVNSSSYMNGGQSRHRSCSPVNCSPSAREKQEERDRSDEYPGEDRDGNGTPNSDMTDRSTPEDAHVSKRRRRVGEFNCPVCKMALHPIDLESHLLNEVEQLICISQIRRQQQLREPLACSSRESPNALNNKKDGAVELSQDSRWDTYQRIRNNRHSRLRLKTKRRREESGGSGPAHPQVNFSMCRMPLHGSNEHLSSHLEQCIRKNGEIADEDDEPVDIEGDGDVDSRDVNEYEWNNGHRRLSKSSHNASMTAINMTTSKRREDENDSMEVVVDVDEGSAYGCAQYSDVDIQAAIKSPDSSASSPSRDQDPNHSKENKCWFDDDSSNDGAKTGPLNDNINLRMVIQALRTRVKELEKEFHSGIPNDGNHCLVCMDGYRKPVVSISCWHVHCERCWLRSLGTKKLCPQCNMITSASDLRRIFL